MPTFRPSEIEKNSLASRKEPHLESNAVGEAVEFQTGFVGSERRRGQDRDFHFR